MRSTNSPSSLQQVPQAKMPAIRITALAVILLASCASAFAAGPHITSVSQIWARGYQTIQISGTGFGTNRDLGDSQFIQIEDVTGGWSAGHTGDAVTLYIASWTNTLIEITSFGGSYGTGNLSLNGGDVLSIRLWNPQTGAGPAMAEVTVLANATSIFYFVSTTSFITNPGAPIVDDQGNFYGIEDSNGIECDSYYPCGSIYELSPSSTGTYNQTILYTFPGGSEGFGPVSPLARDSAGNLFGATSSGGISSNLFSGVVFEISNGVETVLHTFTGTPDGSFPESGLVADSAGNLYGTTYEGGAYGYGTVYELSPNGSGGFNYSVIHSFQGGPAGDGSSPQAPVTVGENGNLYGTTRTGGTDDYCEDGYGCGTVFELSLSRSGTFAEKLLYEFHGTANGVFPATAVTFDPAGNLYGTTSSGGPSCRYRNSGGCGVVYMLTPATNGIWPETTLYTFYTDSTNIDGSQFPSSSLTYYNGLLYGFAGGGASDTGTLYSLTPGVVNSVQTIYSFGGGYDGTFPVGQPFVGTDGVLYGAAYYGIDILPTTPPPTKGALDKLNSH
jgi:uncharacterized repeat protein (TIGR03803 family)